MSDPERIRPSVYVIAFLLATGSGWAVWAATSHDTLGRDDDMVAENDEHRGQRGRALTWRDEGRGRPRPRRTGSDYTHHDWSQESEAQRLMSLDLPSSRFWSESATDLREARRDPQLFSMWRSFHHQAQSEGDPPLPFEPTARRATLLDSEGDVIRDPASCAVRVLPTRSGRFNCLVRVMCDGQVLYPDNAQRAGYVPCDVENGVPMRAVDDGVSSADGDPQVTFDMSSGTVTVADYDENGDVRYRATLAMNQS